MSIDKNDLTNEEQHVYINAFNHLVNSYKDVNKRIKELSDKKSIWDNLINMGVNNNITLEQFKAVNEVSDEVAMYTKRMLEAYTIINSLLKNPKRIDFSNIELNDLYNWFKTDCKELKKYMASIKDGEDDPNFAFEFPYNTSYNDNVRTQKLLEIYLIIKSLVNKNTPKNVDYEELIKWFNKYCGELRNYFYIIDDLDNENYTRNCILNNVSLKMWNQITSTNKFCIGDHSFIRVNGELRCICCDATTKPYNLDDIELDFLTDVAKHQSLFNSSITEEDLPLLQVLREIEKYKYSHMPTKADLIRIHVRNSHLSDNQTFSLIESIVNDPKYLSDTKAQMLLKGLEIELEEARKTDSHNKSLIIETYQTAKYEVLILSGAHIPTLYESASEDEKYALAKAYHNILKDSVRKCNDYFNNPYDAKTYACYSAIPDLNSKVLEMIIKR